MAGTDHTMAVLQVGDRRVSRFHAIQEIADMLAELPLRIAGFISDWLRSELLWRGRFDCGRSSDRMSASELRHGAFGIDFRISRHHKTTPGDRQASLGAEELQSEQTWLSSRSLAERPNSRPIGIVEKSVLSVRRLSVVLQAESATDTTD